MTCNCIDRHFPTVFTLLCAFIVFIVLGLMESIRKLLLDLKGDIYNVHGDLAFRITELHEIMLRIEGPWTRNADEASEEAVDAPPVVLRVPDYLEVKFESANPELQVDGKFPLIKGVSAFHRLFEQVRV